MSGTDFPQEIRSILLGAWKCTKERLNNTRIKGSGEKGKKKKYFFKLQEESPKANKIKMEENIKRLNGIILEK